MQLVPTTMDAFKFTMNAEEALTKASIAGMKVDVDYFKAQEVDITNKCKEYEIEFFETTPLGQKWKSLYGHKTDIGSNSQINAALKAIGFDKFKITDKGNESADSEVLEKLDYENGHLLLKRNKINTILTNTIKPIIREVDNNGFIHPLFNMHTAKTYRGSCKDPNIQSQAKHDKVQKEIVRNGFMARDNDHFLAEIDLKANEVSIGMSFHRDKNMMRFLSDPTADMHNEATNHNYMLSEGQLVKPLRNANKGIFVFPQFYGAGVDSVAHGFWEIMNEGGITLGDGTPLKQHFTNKGITTFEDMRNHAQKEIDWFWTGLFGEYGAWKEACWELYKKQGYLDYPNGFRAISKMGKTQAINILIQGTAFHFMIAILIGLSKRMEKYNLKSHIIGQIHDSILLDMLEKELQDVCDMYLESQAEVRKKWDFIIYPVVAELDKGTLGGTWANMTEMGAIKHS